MEETLSNVLQNIVVWLDIIVAVVGVFALIATRTPNKSDDKIVQLILDIVNFLGANIGKAKNDPKND